MNPFLQGTTTKPIPTVLEDQNELNIDFTTDLKVNESDSKRQIGKRNSSRPMNQSSLSGDTSLSFIS